MQKQQLKLKIHQKLSPSQIQLMKLIELPALAFEEKINQELEENIALEEEDMGLEQQQVENLEDPFEKPQENEKEGEIDLEEYFNEDQLSDYKSSVYDASKERNDPINFMSSSLSFQEYLINQLYNFDLNKEEFVLAEFIISSIDLDGYLRRDFEELVDDLAIVAGVITTKEKVKDLLINCIQKLDPVGIGARNPRECLLIQLKDKKPSQALSLAIQIIENSFEDFYKKHYEKIQQNFSITPEKLKEVISEIEKLNPKPGSFYGNESQNPQNVIADFILSISNGELQLALESRNCPKIRISPTYLHLFENYKEAVIRKKEEKKVRGFIKNKIDSANSFLEAIKQRQETLLVTMGAIVDYQRDYFLSGDDQKLKPMTLRDIAQRIKMEISTVSRVTSQKYIATPYGTFLIKKFFSESTLNIQGEEISTIEVKKALEEFIVKEDKKNPLTDEKLVELLKSKGYLIARRTVAKYREQMGISVARLRRKLI